VLYCDVSACRPVAELRLSGELASDTVAELGAELTALIRTEHYHLVVDMNALSHVSPICVGVLNRAAAELLPFGGQLTLAGATDADFSALRRAGLNGMIPLASVRRARDSAPSVATD
jgi:anti-anti-sigma factor